MARDWSKGNWSQVWDKDKAKKTNNNLMNQNAWYPEGNWMNYAYATSLANSKNLLAINALQKGIEAIKSAHQQINIDSFDGKIAVANLEMMAQQEEKAEMQYLTTHFPNITIQQLRENPKDFITMVNKLQPNGSFDKQLKYIESLTLEGSKYKAPNNYREDMYQFINYELQDALINEINKTLKASDVLDETESSQSLANQVTQKLKNLVIKKFQSHANNWRREDEIDNNYAQTLQDITDLFSASTNLLDILLVGYGISTKQLQSNINEIRKDMKKNSGNALNDLINNKFHPRSLSHRVTAGGTAREAISNALLQIVQSNLTGGSNSSIKTSVIHTGSLAAGSGGIKPDNIIYENEIDVDVSTLLDAFYTAAKTVMDSDNPRVKNIRAMKALLEKAKGATIVEISDKSYSLTSSSFLTQGGYKAQDSSWGNIEKVLSELQMSQNLLTSIRFLIANSGTGWMNGADYEDIRQQLAAHFAAFLFDDINFSVEQHFKTYSSDANVIHILNLSGILMPLSVILNGIYKSLKQLDSHELESWVKVDVKPHPISLEPNKAYSSTDWDNAFQTNQENAQVELHFMKNFVSYLQTIFNG